MSEDFTSTTPMVFKYAKPQIDKARHLYKLPCTDRMIPHIQVVRKGGENNLHSHVHLDGFYFVLKGRVRFNGPNDTVIGELGPMEGVVVPRNSQYWFESIGTEDLELLQVEASDIQMPNMATVMKDRVDHAARKFRGD